MYEDRAISGSCFLSGIPKHKSRENKQNIALVDVNMSNTLTSFVKIKKQYFKIRVKVMYHILILQ